MILERSWSVSWSEGVAGAVAALLLAPQSGEETCALIKDKSIELRDKATEQAGLVSAKASEFADEGEDPRPGIRGFAKRPWLRKNRLNRLLVHSQYGSYDRRPGLLQIAFFFCPEISCRRE